MSLLPPQTRGAPHNAGFYNRHSHFYRAGVMTLFPLRSDYRFNFLLVSWAIFVRVRVRSRKSCLKEVCNERKKAQAFSPSASREGKRRRKITILRVKSNTTSAYSSPPPPPTQKIGSKQGREGGGADIWPQDGEITPVLQREENVHTGTGRDCERIDVKRFRSNSYWRLKLAGKFVPVFAVFTPNLEMR